MQDNNEPDAKKFKQSFSSEKKCCICLEFITSSENLYFLPCIHFFHEKCVSTWLYNKITCPICRIPIFIQSPDELDKYVDFSTEQKNDPNIRRQNLAIDDNALAYRFIERSRLNRQAPNLYTPLLSELDDNADDDNADDEYKYNTLLPMRSVSFIMPSVILPYTNLIQRLLNQYHLIPPLMILPNEPDYIVYSSGDELDADELDADELDADELDADELDADELDADELDADESYDESYDETLD